ncbi:putative TetR family transcriptional regulator [Kineosphaera limosa NBRC 100340]|uniref:Putative TetR family transcriptional regulator n=2 Tax=Kineosphaera TaxID=211469 RepID=K6WE72_9MICO|nr:putative TetR family transcriptional regulator [Kineosphaera limosa NBRC 100340]
MGKRAYRSDRREADAAATRAAIRAAATQLFIEQGYAITTLRQVAKEAGVGERTLYAAFASKFDLYHHCLDVAISGDEDPVAVRDRPGMTDPLAEPDPAAALTAVVDYGIELLERAGDLIWVGVEAAGADERMSEFSRAGRRETQAVMLRFTTTLAERDALRPGLDAARAADVLHLLASPHTRRVLRRDLGWRVEEYREWLQGAAAQQLLP